VHELVEQLTPFAEKEQADSGSSRAPASSGAANLVVVIEAMPRG